MIIKKKYKMRIKPEKSDLLENGEPCQQQQL